MTAILSLHPVQPTDHKELHSLWTDKDVRRFLWDDEIIPPEQTRDIIETSNRLFQQHSYGIWGVRRPNHPGLIGFAGYWQFRDPPTLALFFGVGSGHWNRGFATECGACLIRYGFDKLGFNAIDASTDVANDASVRVLEKLDMNLLRRATIVGLDTLFYRLTRTDWNR